jgi:hypothetical protein
LWTNQSSHWTPWAGKFRLHEEQSAFWSSSYAQGPHPPPPIATSHTWNYPTEQQGSLNLKNCYYYTGPAAPHSISCAYSWAFLPGLYQINPGPWGDTWVNTTGDWKRAHIVQVEPNRHTLFSLTRKK